MAVLELKPSCLSYLVAQLGYEDENGDYHSGAKVWGGPINCGYTSAGQANEIKLEDGSVLVYSYTVTLPRDCRDFQIGDQIRMRMLDKTWQEFTVKSFQRYQLQCKMWI